MFVWLQTILGAHYTEEIDNQVSAEIGRGFVSRADFNALNSRKKELEKQMAVHDKQLEELKSALTDVETLRKQVAALKTQSAAEKTDYEAQLQQQKIDNAFLWAFHAAKAKDAAAVEALLQMKKAEFIGEVFGW